MVEVVGRRIWSMRGGSGAGRRGGRGTRKLRRRTGKDYARRRGGETQV